MIDEAEKNYILEIAERAKKAAELGGITDKECEQEIVRAVRHGRPADAPIPTIDGDYIKEIIDRGYEAIRMGVSPEATKESLISGIRLGRPVTEAVIELPAPIIVEFTFETLREYAEDYIFDLTNIGGKKTRYGIEYLGGLNLVESLRCVSSYTACGIIYPSDKLKQGVRDRCTQAKNAVAKISKMDPDMIWIPGYTERRPDSYEFPEKIKNKLSEPDLELLAECEISNAKLFLLEGRRGWLNSLLTTHEIKESVKTVGMVNREIRAITSTIAKVRTVHRTIEMFLLYAEDKGVDIRYFDEIAIQHYGEVIRARYLKYAKREYDRRVKRYKSDKRAYTKALSSYMATRRVTRAEAKKHVPKKPEPLKDVESVTYLKHVPPFFAFIGHNFPRLPSGKIINPLKGVGFVGTTIKTRPVLRYVDKPYRLSISSRKVLLRDTDENIGIYTDILNAPIETKRKRLLFIVVRLFRESGARPANMIWLRWEHITGKTLPRKIMWHDADTYKLMGKGAPTITYISNHLVEDIDSYMRDYKPDPKEFVTMGLAIDPSQHVVVDVEGEQFVTMDSRTLSSWVRRLSRFTRMPVLPLKFRKSLMSLVWGCFKRDTPVEEFTGDRAEMVKDHYLEIGGDYISIDPAVAGKFSEIEIARRIFDDEYPSNRVIREEQYHKGVG